MSLRVLVLHDSLQDNGSVRWALTLARGWADAGCLVQVVALSGYHHGATAAVPPDVAVTVLREGRSRARWNVPAALPAVVRAARRADVVVTVSEAAFSVPLARASTGLARRPWVAYVQSDPVAAITTWVPSRWRLLWARCLAAADAVLCVSAASGDRASELGVDRSRVVVVPSAVDLGAAAACGAGDGGPQDLVRSDPPRLVAVGALHPHKGVDRVLEAVAELTAAGRPVCLDVVGDGPERPDLEERARHLGLAREVRFHGHLADPLPVVSAADALVHAARVEAVGLVLLEALALGVPVLAVDCPAGGPRAVLAGGRYGRLVPAGQSLAAAVAEHLDDPSVLRSRALAGRAALAAADGVGSAVRRSLRVLESQVRSAGRTSVRELTGAPR